MEEASLKRVIYYMVFVCIYIIMQYIPYVIIHCARFYIINKQFKIIKYILMFPYNICKSVKGKAIGMESRSVVARGLGGAPFDSKRLPGVFCGNRTVSGPDCDDSYTNLHVCENS